MVFSYVSETWTGSKFWNKYIFWNLCVASYFTIEDNMGESNAHCIPWCDVENAYIRVLGGVTCIS